MDIGPRLRRIRKMKDMTVKDLAEASGVGEKTIYRIEVGEVDDPKISTLAPLVRALDCSADELLFEEVALDRTLTRTLKDLLTLPEEEKLPLLLVLDRYRLGCDLIRDFEGQGFVYKTKTEESEDAETREARPEEPVSKGQGT